jgi:hypothetical protein
MTQNRYLFPLINLLCVLIFIASLFGVLDWGLGSVILIAGTATSTFIGTFLYSKKLFSFWILRLTLAISVVASGYGFFKCGEYLNRTVFDGMVTLIVILYVLLATIFLFVLGRNQPVYNTKKPT